MNKRELPPITMNAPFGGLVSGKTAIGENVRPWHLHAAHPTLPLPCEVLVQSLRTGKTVKVRVNDRGPFIKKQNHRS